MERPQPDITHNAASRRFEANVDGLLCRCDYRMHGDTMMLVHTEVPPQFEGRAAPFAFSDGVWHDPQDQIFKMPPVIWTTQYTLQHYVRAITRSNFEVYFKNSLIVSISVTVLNVLVTALAGYAFARLKWRGRETLFIVVLAVMMLPGLIALIPTFLIVKATPFAGGNNWLGQGGTGWLDSFQGLIFPSIGGGFYVFLLRQFFLSLPKELDEAAIIDGCGKFGVFFRIIVPLASPALVTTALFTFLWTWDDFFAHGPGNLI